MNHAPYRSTPVFDQDSLPAALRRDHDTKDGVWGVIRVLDGAIRLHIVDPPEVRTLSAGDAGVVAPRQKHWVEVIGPMRLRVDFHDSPPDL